MEPMFTDDVVIWDLNKTFYLLSLGRFILSHQLK